MKKTGTNVDNCPGFSEKRYQVVCQIQDFLREGCSYRETAELTEADREYIYKEYLEIMRIKACIREFRMIFEKQNVPLMYLFIETYKMERIKSLRSFANGLERDTEAAENAVAYDYSNGVVEGTNSRLKTIERTMYGRILYQAADCAGH